MILSKEYPNLKKNRICSGEISVPVHFFGLHCLSGSFSCKHGQHTKDQA